VTNDHERWQTPPEIFDPLMAEFNFDMVDIDAQWLGRALSEYMHGVNETLKKAGVIQLIDSSGVMHGPTTEHHRFPFPGCTAGKSDAEGLFYAFVLFVDTTILRRIESVASVVWRTAPEISTARDFDPFRMSYSVYCRFSVALKRREET